MASKSFFTIVFNSEREKATYSLSRLGLKHLPEGFTRH